MTPMQTDTRSGPTRSRCGCGCADCQGECCKLECLTRPNFYCGQLLTDGNLKDLVDWVQAKSALQRFREGWGVACGLEVTCSHKEKEQARVYVSEGYAVDCCGRDIVVCEPIWYDFTCEMPFDPCCREPKPEKGPVNQPPRNLACIPLSELRAYELCVVFDEKMTGGQRALVRGNCYPMDDCQFTRVTEKAKLAAKEIKDPCAPIAPPEEKYRRELKLFLEDLARHKSSAQSLREWVHAKLHSFCFVEECLCELAEQEKTKNEPGTTENQEGLYADWIFYIVQDWRNHYFQCLCDPCKDNPCDGDGVPLARVWVWNKTEGDCKICKVVYVDSYPPYRRLLGPDCWYSYPGCVDLSRYIWRDVDEVRQELGRLGFTSVRTEELQSFTKETLNRLLATLAGPPDHDLICAKVGSPLVMRVFSDLCGRKRVVTFDRDQRNESSATSSVP